MSNNEEMNANVDGRLEDSLMQINKLSYLMAPSLGIASARTHVIGFPQQSEYKNGETMVWDSQTGNFFVDPVGSYITFNIIPQFSGQIPTISNLGFGSGSAVNCFNRIVARTRSGKELTRVENLNLFTKFHQRYTHNLDWMNTVGISQGYTQSPIIEPDAVIPDSNAYCDRIPNSGKKFVVPICAILPFMNQVSSRLMPPQLMEGLRLEISLEDPHVALCSVDGSANTTLIGYKITQPRIYWDVYTLADQFTRRIAEISATKGLNLLHREYFHSSVASNNTESNYDVKKACSKALTCHIIARDQSKVIGSDKITDAMASSPFEWVSIQSQIGSNYNPNQPLIVDDTTVNGNLEAYYFSIYGMNYFTNNNTPSVTPEEYTGDATYNNIDVGRKQTYNNAMLTFNLNKSATSDIVGSVVNNSRSLLINLKRKSNPIANIRIDTWLCHVRAVKVFTSNCVVLD